MCAESKSDNDKEESMQDLVLVATLFPMPPDATSECLSDVFVTLAAHEGPWSSREHEEQHLLEARCSYCERRLLHAWRWWQVVPPQVMARISDFPETSAYGAALREFLAESGE